MPSCLSQSLPDSLEKSRSGRRQTSARPAASAHFWLNQGVQRMLALQERVAAATQVGAFRLAEARPVDRSPEAAGTAVFRWVWIVLIGILVVAAAAAFVY